MLTTRHANTTHVWEWWGSFHTSQTSETSMLSLCQKWYLQDRKSDNMLTRWLSYWIDLEMQFRKHQWTWWVTRRNAKTMLQTADTHDNEWLLGRSKDVVRDPHNQPSLPLQCHQWQNGCCGMPNNAYHIALYFFLKMAPNAARSM